MPVEGVEPATFALRNAFGPIRNIVNQLLAALADFKANLIRSQLCHVERWQDTHRNAMRYSDGSRRIPVYVDSGRLTGALCELNPVIP